MGSKHLNTTADDQVERKLLQIECCTTDQEMTVDYNARRGLFTMNLPSCQEGKMTASNQMRQLSLNQESGSDQNL